MTPLPTPPPSAANSTPGESGAPAGVPELTIIIPVLNERPANVETIIERVLALPFSKEVLLVDDGSDDAPCRAALERQTDKPGVRLFRHAENRGKGAALRTGIAVSRGRVIAVQDADLEYRPEDLIPLVREVLAGGYRVMYGSRVLTADNPNCWSPTFYLGGKFLTFAANLLYGTKITDEPTCYKVFDGELLRSIPLRCEGFEFCPEITAKVARRGIKIGELPIHYNPRSIKEGKKIRMRHGLEALAVLLLWRFVPRRWEAKFSRPRTRSAAVEIRLR